MFKENLEETKKAAINDADHSGNIEDASYYIGVQDACDTIKNLMDSNVLYQDWLDGFIETMEEYKEAYDEYTKSKT